MGVCVYCGNRAGFLRGKHRECEAARIAGWRRMVALAAQAASAPDFNEAALHANLASIAQNCWVDEDGIRAAIAQGWREAVDDSLADGILTQEEESRLRAFRDRLALEADGADDKSLAEMDRMVRDRLTLVAQLAAIALNDADARLDELETAIRDSGLSPSERTQLLVVGWESAVEGALDDGLPSLDEEAALARYLRHFNLGAQDVNANGAHRRLIQGAAIREAAEGTVPQRITGWKDLGLNFQKSEQLVWVFGGVDYYEVKARRERRGASHGVSVRVARGLYYSPRQFRSRTHEWEETVHEDTGLLAVTTKHIYFRGQRKRFRVRFDRIVSFEQFNDGFGIMREAQTAKPQTFRTGDGWFVYNLVINLARL